MYRKLGPIVVLAVALSGCATSPFYVRKEASYAPGFIPRNELGQPVFPADKDKKKSGKGTAERAQDQTAAAPAPKPSTPSNWLSKS